MIVFSSVTKQFGTGAIGLKDVSFKVDKGEMLLVTGPSGSGKTTMMRILIRDYLPSEGEVFFHDQNLAELKHNQLPQLRRQIGVVFQDYKLLDDLNVWENISLPLQIVGRVQDEIESRVTDLLKLVDLADKALLFPRQLSGGEAQRVSIARALSLAPDLIFADEPTGNLDPDTSKIVIKLLKKINDLGTTVILATHDQVVLDLLKDIRTIMLDRGNLEKDTEPRKIKKPTDEEKKTDAIDIKDSIKEKDSPKKKALKIRLPSLDLGKLFKRSSTEEKGSLVGQEKSIPEKKKSTKQTEETADKKPNDKPKNDKPAKVEVEDL